jgi:Flp pilus assembly protein TadD
MRMFATLLTLLAATAGAVPPPPPDDPEAAEAVQLFESGRYNLSVPILQEVVARRPDDPDLLTYLALALRRTGRTAEAAAAYEKALENDPTNPAALAYQGVMFLDLGQPDRARANLARLEAACPSGCPERDELRDEIARRR